MIFKDKYLEIFGQKYSNNIRLYNTNINIWTEIFEYIWIFVHTLMDTLSETIQISHTWLNASEMISCSSQSDFSIDASSWRQLERGWSSLMLRHSLPLMSRWVFSETTDIFQSICNIKYLTIEIKMLLLSQKASEKPLTPWRIDMKTDKNIRSNFYLSVFDD